MDDIKLSEMIYEYEDIRKNIELRIIRKCSDELVNMMPCIEFGALDMLLVFYVRLGVISDVEIGFYINNDHLTLWDMTAMKLFEDMVM